MKTLLATSLGLAALGLARPVPPAGDVEITLLASGAVRLGAETTVSLADAEGLDALDTWLSERDAPIGALIVHVSEHQAVERLRVLCDELGAAGSTPNHISLHIDTGSESAPVDLGTWPVGPGSPSVLTIEADPTGAAPSLAVDGARVANWIELTSLWAELDESRLEAGLLIALRGRPDFGALRPCLQLAWRSDFEQVTLLSSWWGVRSALLDRWEDIQAGRWEAAYDHIAPALRADLDLETFLEGKEFHRYSDAREFKLLGRDGDRVYVALTVTWKPLHPLLRGDQRVDLGQQLHLVETWNWEKGRLGLRETSRREEFLAAHPDYQR